jgi:hypothetical protein
MAYNYTRQRQGRDFSIHDRLRKDKNAESAIAPADFGGSDDGEVKKSLYRRLEHYKEEAERNAVPIDGAEPLPERGI